MEVWPQRSNTFYTQCQQQDKWKSIKPWICNKMMHELTVSFKVVMTIGGNKTKNAISHLCWKRSIYSSLKYFYSSYFLQFICWLNATTLSLFCNNWWLSSREAWFNNYIINTFTCPASPNKYTSVNYVVLLCLWVRWAIGKVSKCSEHFTETIFKFCIMYIWDL